MHSEVVKRKLAIVSEYINGKLFLCLHCDYVVPKDTVTCWIDTAIEQ